MSIIWNEITREFPDSIELVRVTVRLTAATALGAVIGLQRELMRNL